MSAQQVHASNLPYKRLEGRPAPKVFGECERRAVGRFMRGFFRDDAICVPNAAWFQRLVDDFQNQVC